MSINKKIHEDSEINNAEKTAENILHWINGNRNKVFGVIVGIALIYVGFASVSYVQKGRETDAKTAFGSAFIEQEKTGSFNTEELSNIYETTTESAFAGYAAYQLASIALEKGEIDAAVEWFDNALAKRPSSDIILCGIYEGKGVALETSGDDEEALKYYEKALEMKTFRKNDIRIKIALLKKKSGDLAGMKAVCDMMINDTTVTPELKQNATNLLITL